MLETKVILVNEDDAEIGTMEKLEAHQKGLLHRAFSILVFNDKQELLIHKRAEGKYHSAGLWTNTCCSHPAPHEDIETAAHRRLKEEMGFDCPVEVQFHFIYKTALENQLTEHELDHVLIGIYNGEVNPSPEEVSDFRWMALDQLQQEMRENPTDFTFWFKLIMQNHYDKLKFPVI